MLTPGDAADYIDAELMRLGRPMPSDEVWNRVRQVTSVQLNLPFNKIVRSSRFIDDLGVD